MKAWNQKRYDLSEKSDNACIPKAMSMSAVPLNQSIYNESMKDLKFVFVHGLSGWGSYDKQNEKTPYWGMRNGDLIRQLKEAGYEACSASVSPYGSAYDRACELYAQLSGTVTDYGIRHSAFHGHPRFGRDFSGMPLIDRFDDDSRLVLIGHSFGGATIRLFSQILSDGIEEEGSDFFQGNKGKRLFSIVTIASPMNGTTAYDLYEDPDFDPSSVKISLKEKFFARLMSGASGPKDRIERSTDNAAFDMHIDNALKMNEEIRTLKHVYYFSQPCCSTRKVDDDCHIPIESRTEPIYLKTSRIMGVYQGKTQNGFPVGRDWLENDGLVNTFSAKAPLGAPSKAFDQNDIRKGTWNVFATYEGDHMSLQGGLFHVNPVKDYYMELLKMISSLED